MNNMEPFLIFLYIGFLAGMLWKHFDQRSPRLQNHSALAQWIGLVQMNLY